MKNSHIEWCDHTFNAWLGCERVSQACVRCYIERSPALRFRKLKLGDMPVRTSAPYWKEPLMWNLHAAEARYEAAGNPLLYPRRPRVFCLSLGDWLDNRVPIEWLADLLKLIHATPNLDWQLLTKRPENFWKRASLIQALYADKPMADIPEWVFWLAEWVTGNAPANVWIGWTGENQEQYDKRTPDGLVIPARMHFISAEPLLSNLDLRLDSVLLPNLGGVASPGVDWVICGGESGPGARPMHPAWARSLRDQCQEAGVPFFFKQWGDIIPWEFDEQQFNSVIYSQHGKELLDSDAPRDPLNLPDGWDAFWFEEGNITLTQNVGKRAAGRLLDGREWNEFPKVEVLA